MSNFKRIIKSIVDEFIYGSHLLSLGAVGIVFAVAIILNVKITLDFLVVVYLIFLASYSYNRLKEYKKDFLTNPERTMYAKKYIEKLPLIISSYILIVVIILFHVNNNLKSSFFGLLILFFGLIYTDFFKSVTEKIIGFKSFYIAFVWASLVIFLSLYYSVSFNPLLLVLFLFTFLRWLLNAIFFDLKDIKSDKKDSLKTIPVYYGKNKTLKLLHIINLLSVLPVAFGIYKNILPLYSLSLSLFYFYGLYYLMYARKKEINFQKISYVMVDGEYIFWPIILLITKFIFEL